jgi:hypothetical protein
MDLRKDCGWPREEVVQPDETADTVSRLICETTRFWVVLHACGRVNDERGAKATPGLGHPRAILRYHRCAAAVQWRTAGLANRSVSYPTPSHCWHAICNAVMQCGRSNRRRCRQTRQASGQLTLLARRTHARGILGPSPLCIPYASNPRRLMTPLGLFCD